MMAAEYIPVEVSCRVLDVSVSGYYEWLARKPSARSVRHAWLTSSLKCINTPTAPTGLVACMPSSAWAVESRSDTGR